MKKKIAIIIIIIAATIGAALIIRKKKREREEITPSGGNNGSGSSSTTTTTSKWQGDNFPLKKYSSGERVKTVQRWLNWTGKNLNGKLVVDGKWGEKTEAEMKRWNIYNDSQLSDGEYNTSILRELNSGYKNYDEYRKATPLNTGLTMDTSSQSSIDGYNTVHLGFGIV